MSMADPAQGMSLLVACVNTEVEDAGLTTSRPAPFLAMCHEGFDEGGGLAQQCFRLVK
jgi:hypothetical protein